jgi:WhiB family transcriptional regulator, redox-sensing transcriptional regulator
LSRGAAVNPAHRVDARTDWREYARCRTEDPELFFYTDGERADDRRRRARKAQAICAQCFVSRQCAAYALTHREGFGVWGGVPEDERIALIVADGDRPRGRGIHVGRWLAALPAVQGMPSPGSL